MFCFVFSLEKDKLRFIDLVDLRLLLVVELDCLFARKVGRLNAWTIERSAVPRSVNQRCQIDSILFRFPNSLVCSCQSKFGGFSKNWDRCVRHIRYLWDPTL